MKPIYTVNRGHGWPIDGDAIPHYPLGETFESDSPDDERGCEQGYLTLASPEETSSHHLRVSGGKSDTQLASEPTYRDKQL
jgi:hypothetical protein